MISISKERLDLAFFRYDSNRFTYKLMGVIKFSFIPLCIIEGIAAVLLTYKHSLILTLLLFCGFIILDIIAAFIFGIIAIYGMAFIHIIRKRKFFSFKIVIIIPNIIIQDKFHKFCI